MGLFTMHSADGIAIQFNTPTAPFMMGNEHTKTAEQLIKQFGAEYVVQMTGLSEAPPQFGPIEVGPGMPPADGLIPVGGNGGSGGDPGPGAVLLITASMVSPFVFKALKDIAIRTARGLIVSVANMPGWLKAALTFLGVDAFLEILIDEGPGDVGIIPVGNQGVGQFTPGALVGPGAFVIAHWTIEVKGKKRSGKLEFWRLSDGRGIVKKLDGSYKAFRYPRTVVLTGSGAKNLRQLIKADKIIARQVKQVEKAMRRRVKIIRKHQTRTLDGKGNITVIDT